MVHRPGVLVREYVPAGQVVLHLKLICVRAQVEEVAAAWSGDNDQRPALEILRGGSDPRPAGLAGRANTQARHREVIKATTVTGGVPKLTHVRSQGARAANDDMPAAVNIEDLTAHVAR